MGGDCMPKFFIKKDSIINSKLLLTGADINHIIKVLRKSTGDILEASDGEGSGYIIRISEIHKDKIIAEILEEKVEKCNDISVTLYQSIPKGDKMDLIVQKCTELGAARIVPFISERTVVVIDDKNKAKKVERWRKIGQEACKQCMRSTVPKVSDIYSYDKVVSEVSEYDLCVVAYEKENVSLKRILKENNSSKSLAVIVGPEGGFSETEIQRAVNNGTKSVSLGSRILRTETAGMIILGNIMYELEDML